MNVKRDVSWLEVGWGMCLGGTVLAILAVLVEAPAFSIVTSFGIVAGGIAAVIHGTLRQDRD